jgi:hypothetical protein
MRQNLLFAAAYTAVAGTVAILGLGSPLAGGGVALNAQRAGGMPSFPGWHAQA